MRRNFHDLHTAEKQNHTGYIRQGGFEKQDGHIPAVRTHHGGTVYGTDGADGMITIHEKC